MECAGKLSIYKPQISSQKRLAVSSRYVQGSLFRLEDVSIVLASTLVTAGCIKR